MNNKKAFFWHFGGEYRFGFNGKEHEDDITGGDYDFGARIYDSRIAKFLSVDAWASTYPFQSPYAGLDNNPISKIDPTGNGTEDFVKDNATGEVSWDNSANNQATTKEGQTYLGKTLTFEFNSFIDKDLWDVPSSQSMYMDPSGDKLTSTITLTGNENSNGELTSISGSSSSHPGPTPIGTARSYYPGEGGSNNIFTLETTSTGAKMSFEQHASVSPIEEFGLNTMGYKIVDVAQKMNIDYNKSTGKLSISSYTNIFPSATLKMNGNNIMSYNQPSFIKTHTAPTTVVPAGRWYVHQSDFSYYPSKFYKR